MEELQESKPMLSPDEIDNDLEGSVLLRKGTSTQIRQRFERIRLGIEFGLLLVLAVLSTLLLLPSPVMRDLSVAPGPHVPIQDILFMPNTRYVSDKTFQSEAGLRDSLRNWLDLTTYGRGIIDVPNADEYTTDPPMVSKYGTTDSAYMISVFHQLHCLSHLMQAYGELHLGLHATKDVTFAEHAAHCFDYLRQSIMCNADVTLQGNSTEGFTWGTTHICRDFATIQRWGNDMASAVGNDSSHL